MHSNETPEESAKEVGQILKKPGNEDQLAKVNRMLASLPPEQASILRERFGLIEEPPPPMDEFDLRLQAMAPDEIWQRYDPLKATTDFKLQLLAELYDDYLHNLDEEMCRKIMLKYPSDFDRFH
jgi:hypothetical protein